MYEWVLATLDASRESDLPGTGLFWDKLRGDGTLDKTLWSYNQGSMIGANVLLARRGGKSRAEYLGRAEAIARKALAHFGRDGYERHPAAFNAIYFRNLLLLHAATGDAALRAEILETIRRYTDDVWYERRDRRDLLPLRRRRRDHPQPERDGAASRAARVGSPRVRKARVADRSDAPDTTAVGAGSGGVRAGAGSCKPLPPIG